MSNPSVKALRNSAFAALALAVLSGVWLGARAQSQAAEFAIESAETWLAMVDRGELRRSWKQAATFFRDTVSQRQWMQAVRPVRARLGVLKSRQFKSATYTSSLPGAPEGDYFVIEFRAQFEHQESAIETVTAMRDRDGEWRVAGYYVK